MRLLTLCCTIDNHEKALRNTVRERYVNANQKRLYNQKEKAKNLHKKQESVKHNEKVLFNKLKYSY